MPEKPPRPGSSPRFSVTEIVPRDAIHPLRPIEPSSERDTLRPPPPLPRAPPVKRTPTAIGMPVPAPPPMRPKLDSREVATETLLAELAAKGDEVRAAEARAEQLRLELEAAKVVIPPPEPRLRDVERAERHLAWLKVAGALVAILGAGTTYLSIRANSVVEPRVDNVLAKQDASKLVADTDHETQRKVLEYLRADRARRDCLDAQIVSALRRGTGHNVTSLTDPAVEWASQNMAPTKAPVLWANATWFTVSSCGPEPMMP